jgi:hypothetical protein
MSFVAVFIAKLLSVFGGAVALACGYFSDSRSVLVWGSIAGATVSEVLLFSSQVTRQFNPVNFAIGVLAMAVWVAVGHFLLGKRLSKGTDE